MFIIKGRLINVRYILFINIASCFYFYYLFLFLSFLFSMFLSGLRPKPFKPRRGHWGVDLWQPNTRPAIRPSTCHKPVGLPSVPTRPSSLLPPAWLLLRTRLAPSCPRLLHVTSSGPRHSLFACMPRGPAILPCANLL